MERKNRGILKNKLFLYLTEFFSGMSVMAVELGASRLLAPYFSSSQIVWTIIIGTIMMLWHWEISMEQNGGQVAQSGQALWTYHRSCFMDCVNSRGRKIYHCWHFCGSDFFRK